MSKERQTVLDRSFEVSLFGIFEDHQIEQVIAELQALDSKVDYSRGQYAKFRVEVGYEYTEVYMDVYREETDAEYKARMLREEKAREKSRLARERKKEKARQELYQKEADERAEYERLRAKFEV